MSNGDSNVDRLVAACLLDTSYLTDEHRRRINEIHLSDEEIKILQELKDKLGLGPLQFGVGVIHTMGGV